MMLRRISFAVALPVALLGTVALATAASSSSTAKVGSAAAGATVSKCGAGTGKKAKGAPIKLGGIAMVIPGVDFSTIGNKAAASPPVMGSLGFPRETRLETTTRFKGPLPLDALG